MKKIDEVYDILVQLTEDKESGVCAADIALKIGIDRTNVSRYLNELYKAGKIEKIKGRPVLYKVKEKKRNSKETAKALISLDRLIGADMSLKAAIQLAKAAISYPTDGLPILILGETGAGKSIFAEAIYGFAVESNLLSSDAPFISFNCADYADNPQLLIAQLFGVKKGAYTGAAEDKTGLLKQADGGIIFLDEIHRLPPQGQELLFIYMDKGYFRPLGETEKVVTSKARLIAATTEEPQSYLLKTFIRRIPVTINLPPLREKTLAERCGLICAFLSEESARINKDIYIERNCFISYLLYNCAGNIGQLKNDIQIACAKAFLNYKSQSREYLFISSEDLPLHVKRGIMNLHKFRDEIETLISSNEEVLYFSPDKDYHTIFLRDSSEGHFYEVIEEKLEILNKSGIEEQEINRILNDEIEKHFKKYIQNMAEKYHKDEISKIVGEEVINTTEAILNMAEIKLNRYMDEKIFFGLALHLQKTIDRIKVGGKIYNPRLNFIRINYPDEFIAAVEAAKLIDQKFKIETPLDEIGYLAMFFVPDEDLQSEELEGKVAVLVAMHGDTTASSMAKVANDLAGTEHVIGLDMPLAMDPEKMYKKIKEYAIKCDRGKGVLLLVDMGSLKNFGNMIAEETNIKIKTVDMVTTLMVIDACHKAITGKDLDEIYESVSKINNRESGGFRKSTAHIENVIITACFTGQGAAKELKKIVEEEYLRNNSSIKVIPEEFINKGEFEESIKKHKQNSDIIAIIGTLDFAVPDIPYISAADLLTGKAKDFLLSLIDEVETYKKIEQSLCEHLKAVNAEECFRMSKSSVINISKALGLLIPSEVKIGIILHMAFLIEKLASGGKRAIFENLQEYEKRHKKELVILENHLKPLEDYFNIDIGPHEYAYLCRMFLENAEETRQFSTSV
ncbi:sigma 54-interacting transcriptional regulator [Tepidanaerobacter syntrophicus]|uniref:sigma 54-interacting transcriptional regulator n=1 Tax=Tepidanaerobacter syntrophicus TaxID=224999 RepID=UPI001BD4BDA9|nr:sigma-54-dependent transcriptional regulator [Tepidanaerobacter syntrophicus]